MGNYIGLGEYNKNSKYLIYYLIFNFIYEGIIGLEYGSLYHPIIIYDKQNVIMYHKLVIDSFCYLGVFLLSLIVIHYEPDDKERNSTLSKKNAYIKLIYDDKTSFQNNKYNTILVAFTWVIHVLFIKIYYQSNFGYLDYWAFEMIITYYISKSMFKIEIYSHQKFSIYFITIFCSSSILCSFILTLLKEKDIIYKKYPICIPIGIIIYLIILFIRSYSNCKIKWLTDLKYISTGKFLATYGIIGAVCCTIICTISTFVDCGKNKLELCFVEKNGKSYFDSFSAFFDEYFKDSLKIIDIILFIVLIISKFFVSLYYVLTIKYLTPVYAICLPSIHYFILQVTLLVNTIIQRKTEIITSQLAKVILEISTDFFSILGIFVYIELIEIKICGLNYNLRRTIKLRSLKDLNIECNNCNECKIEDSFEENE